MKAALLAVAGYCNDVSCHIPSLDVLRGGGYEFDTSMIYYGQPGPLSTNVEASVIAAARVVMGESGVSGDSMP
jgi:neutral ceramidase